MNSPEAGRHSTQYQCNVSVIWEGERFRLSWLTRSPRLTKFTALFNEKIIIEISDDNYN